MASSSPPRSSRGSRVSAVVGAKAVTTPRVWIYKCNSKQGGDWNDFFSHSGPMEWGGTEWTGQSM